MDVMQKVTPFKSSTQVKFNVTKRYLLTQNVEINLDFCVQVSTTVSKAPSSESLERGSDSSQVRGPYFTRYTIHVASQSRLLDKGVRIHVLLLLSS